MSWKKLNDENIRIGGMGLKIPSPFSHRSECLNLWAAQIHIQKILDIPKAFNKYESNRCFVNYLLSVLFS